MNELNTLNITEYTSNHCVLPVCNKWQEFGYCWHGRSWHAVLRNLIFRFQVCLLSLYLWEYLSPLIIHCQKDDCFGYIFVTDSMDLASTSTTTVT